MKHSRFSAILAILATVFAVSASSQTNTFPLSGDVGIGTTSPSSKLTIFDVGVNDDTLRLVSNSGGGNYAGVRFEGGAPGGWALGAIRVVDAGAYNGDIVFLVDGDGIKNVALDEQLRICHNGNVGIGTPNPTNKLDVAGSIRAKEVIVETTGWSDYVLAPDYKLVPLAEVEAHIAATGTLPGIPSGVEVAEQGIGVGDMQAKLLAKIEELTLRQIEQEKRLNALAAGNAALRTEIAALKERKQ